MDTREIREVLEFSPLFYSLSPEEREEEIHHHEEREHNEENPKREEEKWISS